jgi:hypothetical protein
MSELIQAVHKTVGIDLGLKEVKVPKKLHIRQHDCPSCGCSLDRDHIRSEEFSK